MSATITINTETLTNDQLGQIVAVLSQAAEAAADNTQRPGDNEVAEKWARDMEQHTAAAQAAFKILITRVDFEEAVEICDTFGAVPEFC